MGFCFGIVEFKEASAAHKAIQVEIPLIGQVIGDHCRLKDLLQLWFNIELCL
ncbi:unnamed protein product [Rhodiola kirilowii]